MCGAALGWFACRWLTSGATLKRRRPYHPDYAMAGRAGVYDPTDEESASYFGAPDADEGRLQRLRDGLHRVSQSLGRLTGIRAG
jgi:hypothetical protein